MIGEHSKRVGVMSVDISDLKALVAKTRGCILITGPSGSGKSHLCSTFNGAHLDAVGREVDRRWIVDISRLRGFLRDSDAARKSGTEIGSSTASVYDIQCDNLIEVTAVCREYYRHLMVVILRPDMASWRKTCGLRSQPNPVVTLPQAWRDDFRRKFEMTDIEANSWLDLRVNSLVRLLLPFRDHFPLAVLDGKPFNPFKGWYELSTGNKGGTNA